MTNGVYMNNKAIVTENAPKAIGPYSQGICAGDLIFVSGQLPIDPVTGSFPSDDIRILAKQSMDNVKAIVEQAGSSMDKIVKTTVFLKSLADFAAVNEVYASYFTSVFPARSCFEVSNLPKGAKLEIEAIAVK